MADEPYYENFDCNHDKVCEDRTSCVKGAAKWLKLTFRKWHEGYHSFDKVVCDEARFEAFDRLKYMRENVSLKPKYDDGIQEWQSY